MLCCARCRPTLSELGSLGARYLAAARGQEAGQGEGEGEASPTSSRGLAAGVFTHVSGEVLFCDEQLSTLERFTQFLGAWAAAPAASRSVCLLQFDGGCGALDEAAGRSAPPFVRCLPGLDSCLLEPCLRTARCLACVCWLVCLFGCSSV